MNFLGVDLFQSILNFFQTVRDSISLEYLLYIFIGLELLTIVVFIFIVHNVYELRLIRAVDKINAYLYEVQYINESNLIEFNNMMKRVPKTLRYHWQQYMLNRDKNPSYYMSVENCIDRPIKSSSFSSNIKIVKNLGFVYAILAFIFTCGWASSLDSLGAEYFITVFSIPLVVLLLNYLFLIGLNIRKSSNTSELYQTFHIFNRFIDKAVSTMPDYVDFEVLFTAKEIKRGIPVLNEYIEKRQLQEQEEMKRARENAIQHELYDFESAGEKGELVLERAMKETEIFVNMRNRLNSEIEQLEREIESLKRNFENTTKDYQKKLQASKENTDRLREQQEATTNRIENNYIRKQQADEIKKQQQIEKDQEDAQLRFNQEINNLALEIKKRKEELETARVDVEKAMLSEYKTFSNKIYSEIKDTVNNKIKDEREELIESREQVARELEEALAKIDALEMQNKVLVNKAGERESFIRAEIEKEKRELEASLKQREEIIRERDKQIELITADYSKKESVENKNINTIKNKGESKIVEREFSFDDETKPEVDEFGGYYDDNGNYKYKNGTYYDAEGNFHDEKGNIYNKDGILLNGRVETPKVSLETPMETDETVEKEESPLQFESVNGFNEFDEDELFEEPVIEEEKQALIEDVPSKKRGRPRKQKVEEIHATPKKRGRPKKEVIENETPEPPKKRGRPKKEVLEVTAPAKKRGRPRKEEVQIDKPKGKRGRPRKSEEIVVKTVVKRGRPKKLNLDENLKLIEERLKEQNKLLKQQQKALDITVKNAIKPKK